MASRTAWQPGEVLATLFGAKHAKSLGWQIRRGSCARSCSPADLSRCVHSQENNLVAIACDPLKVSRKT